MLHFCDIILFGTTCRSNILVHTSYHSTTLQYFYTLQNKCINFRKAQGAAVWPPLVYNDSVNID